MEPSWMGDWELITRDWTLTDERFAAMGRLLHAANHRGREQGANGEEIISVPEYEIPTL
jgi:hypothetical protein